MRIIILSLERYIVSPTKTLKSIYPFDSLVLDWGIIKLKTSTDTDKSTRMLISPLFVKISDTKVNAYQERNG